MLIALALLPACLPELPDEVKTDTAVDTATDTADSAQAGSAPVISNVRLDPADPRTNDVLRVTFDAEDPDGDTLFTAIAWTVNGARVEGQTGAELDGASWFDRDDVVGVTVSVSDGSRATEASTSVGVANTAPSAPGVAITPAEPIAGQALACAVGTESVDADGDAMTYGYSWTVDGVDAGVSGPSVDAARTRAGEMWTCRVTGSDGSATGEATSTVARVRARGDCTSVSWPLGEYVSAPMIASYPSSWTLEGWFRPDGTYSSVWGGGFIGLPAVERCGGGSDYGLVLIAPDWSDSPGMVSVTGGWLGHSDAPSGGSWHAGEWFHFALSRGADRSGTLFINGVIAEQFSNVPAPDPSCDMYIGNRVGSANNFVGGSLASLRFSNGLRYTSPFDPENVLVADSAAIWAFDFGEGSGSVAEDAASGLISLSVGAFDWDEAGPGCAL